MKLYISRTETSFVIFACSNEEEALHCDSDCSLLTEEEIETFSELVIQVRLEYGELQEKIINIYVATGKQRPS